MTAAANTPSVAEIRVMPKLELHIHLEGAISTERILSLAAAANEPLPRPIEQLFRTRTLDEFLANLDWVCSLARSPEAARALALDFARYAADEGIVYAEVIINPTHWKGLDVDTLLRSVAAGFDEAQHLGLADLRILPSILRQQSLAEAMALVEWMGQAGLPRIVGLSVDGNQARAVDSSHRLAPAFARAMELGFGRTVHAGESSGPEGVAAALDLLAAQRIDHGVRAAEDPSMVARLAASGVTLNICLSSNCHLLYRSVSEHPILQLIDAGVRCTLNTDDPVVLGTTLCGELHWAATALGWGMDALVRCQRNAIAAAFCNGQDKQRLGSLLDVFESREITS